MDDVIKIELGGSGGTGKSIQDLRKEYKELQKELSATKEGTKEYQAALEKLGAVKDDIGDLRDTINALNPEGKVAAFAKVGSTIASGFAAAQGAAALFGAESEELQKTMLKVQAAMALAEGIKGITAAGDAFKVLNTAMRANPVLAIVAGFTALTAGAIAVYNHFKDVNSVSAQMAREHEKLKESTASLTKAIDTQIIALKGLKANDEKILELTEKKLKANIELEKSSLRLALAKQAEAEAEFNFNEQALRLAGKNDEADKLRLIRTKEQRDATKIAIESLKESIAGLSNFHNEQEQKKLDKTKDINKKALDEATQAAKDKAEAEKRYIKEMDDYRRKIEEDWKRDQAIARENFKKSKFDEGAEDQAFNDELTKSFIEIDKKRYPEHAKTEEQIRAEKQKTFDQTINGTREAVQKTQAIFDLYFQWQLKQNKGNAAKETEIRKKQFNVNKAFGVAGSIIDGIGAIQKALNNPYPLNIILAVLTGVLATANTIKIASTKFDDGGGSSTADVGGGALSSAPAPVIPQPNNTVTKISDEGKVETKQPIVKAIVVESDMTESQKRITTIQETAKFG